MTKHYLTVLWLVITSVAGSSVAVGVGYYGRGAKVPHGQVQLWVGVLQDYRVPILESWPMLFVSTASE